MIKIIKNTIKTILVLIVLVLVTSAMQHLADLFPVIMGITLFVVMFAMVYNMVSNSKIEISREIEAKIGDKDELTEAVGGLDTFTKHWCVDKEMKDRQKDLVFRCSKCEFSEGDTCMIKKFANEHESYFPMDKFGSMSR